MTDSKSVKLAFDCVGGDFERAGEASSKIKKIAFVINIKMYISNGIFFVKSVK